MNQIKKLLASEKSLMSGEMDFDIFRQSIAEMRTDRILKITQAIPNLVTEIKEEEKLIILIDIVGFSKDSTRNQVYKIYLFQRYLISQILNNRLSFGEKIRINHFVPTGDGCYIVAEKCTPQVALDFLITLISGFKDIKTEHGENIALRASALFGNVVPFIDMAKHLNYIGEGMNEASRILSGGQKYLEEECTTSDPKAFSRNSLYLGDSLTENIKEYENDCTKIYYFNDVPDKHGIKRNVTVLQGIL